MGRLLEMGNWGFGGVLMPWQVSRRIWVQDGLSDPLGWAGGFLFQESRPGVFESMATRNSLPPGPLEISQRC